MELKWLQDFVALVEHGSFSKAAESRFVTQPAFSRRIRSLETWLGVNLVDRDQYPTRLTPAGEAFEEQAHLLIDQIYSSRNHVRGVGSAQEQVVMLSQHALSVSFFPNWMQTLEDLMEEIAPGNSSTGSAMIRVDVGNLHDIVETFLAANSDFLLSYASTDIFSQLGRQGVESLQVGTDELVAVTGVDNHGIPFYSFDSELVDDQFVKLLAHPAESFFGKLIQRDCIPHLPANLIMQSHCENALSEALKALVLKGYGIAWLPKSLILKELERNELCLFSELIPSITLNIKLYRLCQPRHQISKEFWEKIRLRYAK